MATPEEVQALVQRVETLGRNIAEEGEAKRDSNRLQRRGNRILAAVGAALVVLTLVVLSGVDDTKDVASDTNQVVKDDLVEAKHTIYQYDWVLQQQAVPSIIGMCDTIKSLGGECPTVVLDPSKAPPDPDYPPDQRVTGENQEATVYEP